MVVVVMVMMKVVVVMSGRRRRRRRKRINEPPLSWVCLICLLDLSESSILIV
jgi:hypothetical protein